MFDVFECSHFISSRTLQERCVYFKTVIKDALHTLCEHGSLKLVYLRVCVYIFRYSQERCNKPIQVCVCLREPVLNDVIT